MDQCDTTAIKRRKVTGTYRMRAKKEVMDCSQPHDDREIASKELDKVLPDAGLSEQSVQLVEPCVVTARIVKQLVRKIQMDDQVSEQRSVLVEQSEGRGLMDVGSRYR